jgi:hypothetical protein
MISPGNMGLEDPEVFLVNFCIGGEDDHLFSSMLEKIHDKIAPMFAVESA